MKKKITCIGCPLGCEISVAISDGKISSITGYSCRKGEEYAREEVTDPRRVLTTTIPLKTGGLVSVKTDRPVKKGMLLDCMKKINEAVAEHPVEIGDVLVEDILGTGANVVATSRA